TSGELGEDDLERRPLVDRRGTEVAMQRAADITGELHWPTRIEAKLMAKLLAFGLGQRLWRTLLSRSCRPSMSAGRAEAFRREVPMGKSCNHGSSGGVTSQHSRDSAYGSPGRRRLGGARLWFGRSLGRWRGLGF